MNFVISIKNGAKDYKSWKRESPFSDSLSCMSSHLRFADITDFDDDGCLGVWRHQFIPRSLGSWRVTANETKFQIFVRCQKTVAEGQAHTSVKETGIPELKWWNWTFFGLNIIILEVWIILLTQNVSVSWNVHWTNGITHCELATALFSTKSSHIIFVTGFDQSFLYQ